MEWTDDSIARLRSLWAEGLSTAEIGRRLNISKNAVVGKAHRLNLPARPRRSAAPPARPRRARWRPSAPRARPCRRFPPR
ncbi:GcrA family cell cycle regulator [Acidocella sp. MX-AZ03]|nr:GcrA family cell cycle regulator [Acidocella sp. MX-AZ03]WBO59682.1 GcrA family cell cycle regulator [Acidocella sp. MX-AZ03]